MRMSRFRRCSLTWLLVPGIGALTWFALHRGPTPATWLSVRAATPAVVGQELPVDVELAPEALPRDAEALMLAVDIHGLASRRKRLGYLAGASPQMLSAVGGDLHFSVPLPNNPRIEAIHLVIFTSPTGGWFRRVRAARSEVIPVRTAASNAKPPQFRDIEMVDITPDPPAVVERAPAIRLFVTAGWCVLAGIWWLRRSRTGWRLLAVAAVATAVLELLPLEHLVADRGRELAVQHDWYELRAGYQQFATLLLVMGTAAIGIWAWEHTRDHARRLALGGLALNAGVLLAATVSLHDVDALLAAGFAGVSLLQVIQLLALGLAGIGLWSRRSPENTRPT